MCTLTPVKRREHSRSRTKGQNSRRRSAAARKIRSLFIHVRDTQENRKLSCYRVHLAKERKIRDAFERGGENERLGEKEKNERDREGREGRRGREGKRERDQKSSLFAR